MGNHCHISHRLPNSPLPSRFSRARVEEMRNEKWKWSRIESTIHPAEVRLVQQEVKASNGHGLVYRGVTLFDSYAVLGHMDEMKAMQHRADTYW